MLINLIREHALADAEAGNWSAVAASLNALTQTVTVGRVGGKASLSALVAAGIDPSAVITAMRADPMASELLNTLTASGVDWADDLTGYVMDGLVAAGKITQQTVDVMRSLSVRSEPVISTSAKQCQAAWDRNVIQSIWDAKSAVVAEGIHDGTITTIDQIIAVIGGE